MNKSLFSIIVPVYNTQEYICQCVDSILSQSYTDYELILVDDGSSDKSGDICDEYLAKDARIKVIHKKNGGLSNARKTGAEIAGGKYVLNVDSDDYVEPDTLKTLADICEILNPDMVCYSIYRAGKRDKTVMPLGFETGMYITEDSSNSIYNRVLYDDTSRFYSFGIHPSLCSKAIKRELYVQCQNSADGRISMGEDLAVSLPAMLISKSIYVINKPLYNYRVNEQSITGKYNPNEFEQLVYLLDNLKSNVDLVNDIEKQLDAYIYHRFYNICISEFINNKSYFKTSKKLKGYNKILCNYISDRKSLYNNKKYKLSRFVIMHKLWSYFWINSIRIKKKKASML